MGLAWRGSIALVRSNPEYHDVGSVYALPRWYTKAPATRTHAVVVERDELPYLER